MYLDAKSSLANEQVECDYSRVAPKLGVCHTHIATIFSLSSPSPTSTIYSTILAFR